MDTTILSFILGLSVAFIVILSCAGLIFYIFSSIGLFGLAKNDNIEHAWFAWIPFLRGFLLGELVDDNVLGVPYMKWILSIGSLIVVTLSLYATDNWIVWILSTIFYIFEIGANYKLFKIYRPSSAVAITIIGIFIPFIYSIWYFVIRNDARKPIA